eukprot:TRINITY_DN11804_c0_g1_i1.p2 TRINITY_DN11804_c0_g1~~TRINITY_DN11804_c0_g1_i1.p2  ORF type:complete len:108 (-),score=2.88 TRINITY_DN11804_c0_g1_i1:20-343(-)
MHISILRIKTELFARFFADRISNGLDSFAEPFKNSFDISTIFHRNYTELVFFVNPDEESFCIVMENTTTSGQSLSIPATVRFLSPDTKRKWSSTSCCRTASSIPVSG